MNVRREDCGVIDGVRLWKVYDESGVQIGTDEQTLGLAPLQGHQVIATLNAVLGLWTLTDAANAAGVSAEHLIAEAQAWAAAKEQP